MTQELLRVETLVTFADKESPSGLRKIGDMFDCPADRVEYFNSLHEFDLVKIVDKPAADQTDDEPPAGDKPDDVELPLGDELGDDEPPAGDKTDDVELPLGDELGDDEPPAGDKPIDDKPSEDDKVDSEPPQKPKRGSKKSVKEPVATESE